MSATPRDLLKPRPQRLHEVYESIQEQAGQANAQQVAFGLELELAEEGKKFAISAGEGIWDGVSLPQKVKAVAATSIAAGAALEAGQNCYVLIEITKGEEPEVKQTVSPKTAGTPVLPELTAGRLAIGYLSLKGAFMVGTTKMTAENLVAIKYSAGNVSPTSGF